MRVGRILFVILITLAFTRAGLCAGMEAGVARVEITPPTGMEMAGYSARREKAEGVLDPLFLYALILRSNGRSVGFAVYDLIGPPGNAVNGELSGMIREAVGLDEVVFIATHTHAGPALSTTGSIASLPAYEKSLRELTVQAMTRAAGNLAPVRLGTGCGSVDISYNRIRPRPDGGVEMVWENPGKEPLGPAEQTVLVLKLDDMTGKTRAIVVNYACHPVILGSDNLLYSPDYPGAMRGAVEESHPDKPLCIFINGACGDMNPYFADENEIPSERVTEVGHELAREVLRVAESIVTQPDNSSNSVSVKNISYRAEGRWDLERWAATASDEGMGRRVERLSGRMRDLNLPVSLVLITPEIGFVGLPGEFFSSFQRSLRELLPLKGVVVAGYTNRSFGYFPTVEAAALGGYGANDEATYVRPGTGEHIVVEALTGFHELLGRLRPIPASGGAGYRE